MWYFRLRNRHFWVGDVIAIAIAPFLALALRAEPEHWLNAAPALALFVCLAWVVKLPIFYYFGFYRHYWRYVSIEEMFSLMKGAAAATSVMGALYAAGLVTNLFSRADLPGSVFLLDGLVTLLAVGGTRFSIRLAEYWRARKRGRGTRPVLIVGAGNAGSTLAREMFLRPHGGLEPVGFVDDDPHKQRVQIHGVRVLGVIKKLPELLREYRVREVIIAMPDAPGAVIREVVRVCEDAGVESKILPGLAELLAGQVNVNGLRQVQIEDLLRRETIQVDMASIASMIAGKRVLVTGAGGSIGSELCRQIARCQPAQLIALGHGENSLFALSNELERQVTVMGQYGAGRFAPTSLSSRDSHLNQALNLKVVVADVRDRPRLQAVFERLRPQMVFHAAAHKHVPMMEENIEEAVTNNVLGTRNVVELAEAYQVERFVLVSTDKAVNPVSIMGVTKRAAERVVYEIARSSGRPYVAVRFGNVLGSRGSVVPVFQRQIAAGGPVTVTHPEMSRYFMTIPEAVQLVLQAAALSDHGEVFILDMGQPVKIVDLARDLIRLSGLQAGRDIEIVFTGLRPGEKLHEELFLDGEEYGRTFHHYIYSLRNGRPAYDPLFEWIDKLIGAARQGKPEEVRYWLQRIVPEYCSDSAAQPSPLTAQPLGERP